jgi:hypothetical protein
VLNGVIGLGIFFVIENLLYYGRIFAGGDSKLLLALGTILPLSYEWMVNLKIVVIFILLFLVLGSVYALVFSFYLAIKNRRKFKIEFRKGVEKYRKIFLFSLSFFVLWIAFIVYIHDWSFLFIGIIFLLFPVLFVYAKAVEESCMVASLKPLEVTEGDWLYKDVIIRGKKIKSCWDGLSKKELDLIRKSNKNILIKQGIPFTPSFLLAFIGLLFLIYRYTLWF